MLDPGLFGPLHLETRDEVLWRVEQEWPQFLAMTVKRFEILKMSGNATRRGGEITIEVANGWATYLVLEEADGELELELLDGEVEGA